MDTFGHPKTGVTNIIYYQALNKFDGVGKVLDDTLHLLSIKCHIREMGNTRNVF